METVVRRPWFRAPVKLSWGAIFGGAFVAVGLWILLYALGAALGLSSILAATPNVERKAFCDSPSRYSTRPVAFQSGLRV